MDRGKAVYRKEGDTKTRVALVGSPEQDHSTELASSGTAISLATSGTLREEVGAMRQRVGGTSHASVVMGAVANHSLSPALVVAMTAGRAGLKMRPSHTELV